MQSIQGFVLGPHAWVRGRILVKSGRIVDVEGTPVSEAEARAGAAPLLLPGFIDTHLHGGGGRDVMDGGDAAEHIAAVHARCGTTSWLATTMTAPRSDIESALRGVAAHMQRRSPQAATCLGVHLEGPYISPERLGAQPAFARAASLSEVRDFHAIAPIRLITLAPELQGQGDFIESLVAAGLRVQLGHSRASYEQTLDALQRGASGFTHLFNAMSALQHREPGMVGAALAHAEFAEIIPDLQHVHAGAIRAALRAIPCLYCVSDATAATGMPDGEYRLGRQRVFKCLGAVRLQDQTLAGSALTLDQAVRNLVSIGLSLQEASRRCAAFPAARLGLADRGQLTPGAWADIVALDPALQVQGVWVEGQAVDLSVQPIPAERP